MKPALICFRSALIVQIQLQQNRTDLALKEAQSARRWAQDSLLVNLAEAWVGLRIVRHTHHGNRVVPSTLTLTDVSGLD